MGKRGPKRVDEKPPDLESKRKGRARGVSIDLDQGWYNDAWNELMADDAGLEKLGSKVGLAYQGREYDKNLVDRWLKGDIVTDRATRAVAKYLGRSYPMLAAAHQEEVEWFEAGRELRQLLKDRFLELLEKARRLTALEKEKRKLDDDLEKI